jgi:hypothetical protein
MTETQERQNEDIPKRIQQTTKHTASKDIQTRIRTEISYSFFNSGIHLYNDKECSATTITKLDKKNDKKYVSLKYKVPAKDQGESVHRSNSFAEL